MIHDFNTWCRSKVLVEKWGLLGILKGSRDPHSLVLCLEGQRIQNEQNEEMPKFLRLSIPIMRRLHEAGVVEGTTEELPHWHTFKTRLPFNPLYDSEKGNATSVLNTEAAQTIEMVQEMAAEIKAEYGKVKARCIRCEEGGRLSLNFDLI